ncbi:hypothetical protein C7212DRAFT_356302 [Tuber magnatum]|uniref:Uncharacterized protein n=1 Tax=Tuber magnatum TaxID=42249 RepID=A0A317T1X3_9PEZI|nr:hypothetical protein C7212DRAFT_356302 [Tuber magnatum]
MNCSMRKTSPPFPITREEACTGFTDVINNITATRGMSEESFILGRLIGESAQYRGLDYDFRPTDPRVERMLEDFERSEFEGWRFDTVQFYDLYESQWRVPFDQHEAYDRLVNDAAMLLIERRFQERLLDGALLEDLERYEEEEEEFWMMRGVAQTYGMWDEEYWQAWRPGPWRKSTRHSDREEREVDDSFQAGNSRDIKSSEKVPWWKICEHHEDRTPSVIFRQEPPRRPNQRIEPQRPIYDEKSSAMLEGMEHLDPCDDDPASPRSECGQSSVYQELPEEDPDWVKLDEKEDIALPLPPSPMIETCFIKIPKIPEPRMEEDESWTLIVPSW